MAVLPVQAAYLLWHHAAVISSGSGLLVEVFVPLNDLTSGAAEAVFVEDFSAADTYMAWYNFLAFARSEEHTYEIQSLTNLVCCLLLAQ